jgi:transcriptional regulator MraZ
MFFGTYHHKLNSKNQVTVPSRLRAAVDEGTEGQGFYLFVAESNCLYLFTPRGIDEVVERARSKWSGSKQDFLRMFYARIAPVECDGQGRIVVPAAMKESVGISKDVVFVGAHRRVELWNPDTWSTYEKSHRDEYGQKLGMVVEDVFGL